MNAKTPPPRGLGWSESNAARLVAFGLAFVSIVLSLVVTGRQSSLTDCLRDRDLSDKQRTRAIAMATDAERVAQRRVVAAGPDVIASARADWLRAIDHTDAVRRANPAPEVVPCS